MGLVTLFIIPMLGFSQTHDDDGIRAAKTRSIYMVNFAKYTAWPVEMRSDTFFFGVSGAPLVLENLQKACETKSYHSRPMKALDVQDLTDLEGVHMLYIAKDVNKTVLSNANKSHTLLISNEYDINLAHINFIDPEESSLKYEINEKLIKEAELSTKEELSNLAIKVVK